MEVANLQITGRHDAASLADAPSRAATRSRVTLVGAGSRLVAQLEAALIARGAWDLVVDTDAGMPGTDAVTVLALDVRGTLADAALAAWRQAAARERTQVVVAVDGMRSVGNEYEPFKWARAACEAIARAQALPAAVFVPVSSDVAANVGLASAEIEWYDGPTLADAVIAAARRPRTRAPGWPAALPGTD